MRVTLRVTSADRYDVHDYNNNFSVCLMKAVT